MNIEQAVRERLESLAGWHALHVAVGGKTYATAVGLKDAHAYLERWGGGAFVLTGQYYSEGNNALSTVRVNFDEGMTEETIRSLVDKFASEVDARVAGTYAMRLQRFALAAA